MLTGDWVTGAGVFPYQGPQELSVASFLDKKFTGIIEYEGSELTMLECTPFYLES